MDFKLIKMRWNNIIKEHFKLVDKIIVGSHGRSQTKKNFNYCKLFYHSKIIASNFSS